MKKHDINIVIAPPRYGRARISAYLDLRVTAEVEWPGMAQAGTDRLRELIRRELYGPIEEQIEAARRRLTTTCHNIGPMAYQFDEAIHGELNKIKALTQLDP